MTRLVMLGTLIGLLGAGTAAADWPPDIVLRGAIRDRQGNLVKDSRIETMGLGAPYNCRAPYGRYTLTLRPGLVKDVWTKPTRWELGARIQGRRMRGEEGRNWARITLTPVRDGGTTRWRITSDQPQLQAVFDAALAGPTPREVVVELDFGGAAPAAEAPPAAIDATPVAPVAAAAAAPAAAAPVPTGPVAVSSSPPPATPEAAAGTPEPAAASAPDDDCRCRIQGTVEVQMDRPLLRPIKVELAVRGRPEARATVEIYMGPPREFEITGVPCGSQALEVEPVQAYWLHVPDATSVSGLDCLRDAVRRTRIVLTPR
jgi:hypothetical protein